MFRDGGFQLRKVILRRMWIETYILLMSSDYRKILIPVCQVLKKVLGSANEYLLSTSSSSKLPLSASPAHLASAQQVASPPHHTSLYHPSSYFPFLSYPYSCARYCPTSGVSKAIGYSLFTFLFSASTSTLSPNPLASSSLPYLSPSSPCCNNNKKENATKFIPHLFRGSP